ncbi:response regulator [Chlorogloea sp. CCALA 695]|uniref:response regulator n=1 Tax=Chlorogloea sp. CCALA 695 TaxID=2107693 RepID=UPI000D04D6F1|nr:response regulator [Chlorogloea sp. CCALA 695]PSB31269.1 transcriptional regulator [Chlorogloea sp. CCALA 695]
MKILLVEDDDGAASVLKNTLTEHHYLVDLATDGQAGLSLAQAFAYDLILLDVVLPKLDGIRFCRQLRYGKNDTPILLLTALDSSTSKVIGLDAGANDYLVKPFDTNELLARIRALVRRGSPARSSVIEVRNLKLDSSSCRVSCNGELLHLTAKEYTLLELLLRNSHRIFSQSLLLEYLWSSDEKIPLENTVRTHIKTLRQKLKQTGADGLIETVYGLGYRLKLGKNEVKHQPVVMLRSQDDTSDSVTSTQPQISSSLAALWERFKPQYESRITVLESAIKSLVAGTLTQGERQQSVGEAHLLVGSLGSFGFAEASRLCREIEQIFRDEAKFSEELEHLLQLVVALRQELERPTTTSEPPAEKKTTVKQQLQMLIVDNDVQLGEQLIKEATIWGIQARAATNITQARDAIARKCPDVVLLDLCFDGLAQNGLNLLAELTTRNQNLPVLVFTAVEDFANRVKVARLGVTFLSKPALPASVLATVTQMLQQSKVVQAKILIVDDDPQMLDILRTILAPWGFILTLLDNPQHFWTTLEVTNPDLLILDIEMPNLSGIDLCRVVRNDPHWSELPVLFLSAHSDIETVTGVFVAGADDYVSKPVLGPELIARVLNRLERTFIFRKLAETDVLTGIANRRKSIQELTRLLHLAQRQGQPMCFIILDFDHFNQVNNKYGHDAGDRVLSRFGALLLQTFRSEDMVGRWGGEEFVVGLYNATRLQSKARLTELLEIMRQQEFTSVSGEKFQVTFSGGISQYPADGRDLQALYQTADVALYAAKAKGRNQIVSS